jgi:hypothetical protein
MPDVLGSGPAFGRLVENICNRKWLPADLMKATIPTTYRPRLFRARMWTTKAQGTYDKMIRAQPSRKLSWNLARCRREDPSLVAF